MCALEVGKYQFYPQIFFMGLCRRVKASVTALQDSLGEQEVNTLWTIEKSLHLCELAIRRS